MTMSRAEDAVRKAKRLLFFYRDQLVAVFFDAVGVVGVVGVDVGLVVLVAVVVVLVAVVVVVAAATAVVDDAGIRYGVQQYVVSRFSSVMR